MKRVDDAISAVRMSARSARRIGQAPREAGRVHSVFDRAVNLLWHDGRLLTMQGAGALVAPFAVELSQTPSRRRLLPGATVWRDGERLDVGGVAIDCAGAIGANTAMPESATRPLALSTWLAASHAAHAPGLSSERGRSARAQLAAGLGRRNAEDFVAGARGLLGLGEGLTPARDDCLVGALAAIHRFARGWLNEYPAIRSALASAAGTATTAIAQEFIAHALDGHFAESLIDLFTAESESARRTAVTRLTRTGATSGADTLAGVRLALTALGTG